MQPRFIVTPMETYTTFGPLVALGFFVQQHDLWAPVRSRVCFTQSMHCDDPVDALLDMGVGILAGCEVVAQINTTIRPDRLLAQAWGREQFREQSTIARVLDACGPLQVQQMRQANEQLLRWTGRVYQHDFSRAWLLLDIDLTALLASKRADGSEKGYFPGKKTRRAANWRVWRPSTIEKSSFPGFCLAPKPVWPRCNPSCSNCSACCPSSGPNASAR